MASAPKQEYRKHPETGLPQRWVDSVWVDLHPDVDVDAMNAPPRKRRGSSKKTE